MDEDGSGAGREVGRPTAPTAMPVAGFGVALSSLESLRTIFSSIEPEMGAAFVIAVRQQEGLSVDLVLNALREHAPFPVKIGEDGERLEPNHIYVGGQDDTMALRDGHLRVSATSEPIGQRAAVDTLLISIAEHARDRAVAVVLGGLGSDGTAGVTATKKFGGLSIGEMPAANDPLAADGAAGPLGVVDFLLPAEQIAGAIGLHLDQIGTQDGRAGSREAAKGIDAHLGQIVAIVREATGHDFHGYKKGTFIRRVQRRLQVLQVDSIEAYVARLRADRREAQDLFQDLLIGVTQFFRDPQEFELLEAELPRLFAGRTAADQVRVWVLGCATGEEAYSISILLREHMSSLPEPPQVQVFATDLDARALGLARAGRYSAAAVAQIRADRLDRWFVREGDTYCVSKELREMCIFSPHSVVKDAPFSRIDILSCRNLLIYLNAAMQDRVIPIFHFSLRPGGVLFLGPSENVSRHPKLFEPIDRRSRVFRRLDTAMRIVPAFDLTAQARGRGALEAPPPVTPVLPSRLPAMISRQAEILAERYAPAYVVVDDHFDVLHFSGRTGRFLEPVAGTASLGVLGLVHRDLRTDLRAALQQVLSDRRRIEIPRLRVQGDDRIAELNLIVEPVGAASPASFMVLFQDVGTVPEGSGPGARRDGDEDIQRLETELRVTRERLQATIEELETTNEELKSSNEEYQSINEELQAASEETETSKEELQSVNEELQTVNGELGHRIAELSRSNSDLKNLLEATRIGTVFLDNDLRIRSFTPSATDIFHLVETDVGRPLEHVVSRVDYRELPDDVRRVLRTLVPVERTVVDPQADRHFAAKVLPYRSVDNYISGVVVTFTDLTAVHEAESALRRSEARLQALVAASSELIFRVNADWTSVLDIWGDGLLRTMQGTVPFASEFIPADDRARIVAALSEARQDRRSFVLEHQVWRADGRIGWGVTRAVPVIGPDGEVSEWFGAMSDITARRDAEEALRESQQRLASLVEGLPLPVWRAVASGGWTWASTQWTRLTGQAEADSHGGGWLDPVHPDDRETAKGAWTEALSSGRFAAEFRLRHPADGTYRWFQTRATPIRDAEGGIVEWIGTSNDIDDLRGLQERQTVLVGELQHRTRNLLGIVRQMAERTMQSSPDLPRFRERYRARLDALARVQGLLSRLKEHDRVTFDQLIRAELEAHGVEIGQDPHVVLDGPSGVRLRSTTVQTVAMALHELATNASKHGALREGRGRLAVTWHVGDETGREGAALPWLHIDWRETDVALASSDAGPERRGQGRELIERALPYQLSARTTYVLQADGVHCTIAIPVSRTNASNRPAVSSAPTDEGDGLA